MSQATYLQLPLSLNQAIDCVAELLSQQQLFFGHGTNNAFDESAWLCLWVLNLPLTSDLAQVGERHLTSSEIEHLNQLLTKRITLRQPTAYLTNEAWLQGWAFYVDHRCIIPRSFIAELLVDGSIEPWLSKPPQRVLDLCTGNGSLAIIAALCYPEIIVDAADLSSQALEVAQINLTNYQLGTRINLVQSDMFTNLNQQYDLILCNPPYVNSHSMRDLPAEYLQEPHLALAGGEDGMDFIRPFLQQVSKYLTAKGVVVLEIGNEYPNFINAFAKLQPIWLSTSDGADTVLLLTKDALVK